MRDSKRKHIINDIILIAVLCVIALLSCVFIYMGNSEDKLTLEILIDGKLVESVDITTSLSKCIQLDTGNEICIADGTVYMKSADCPDGLCVKQGHISDENESIICLPNKVVVRLVNNSHKDDTDGLDVMPR